MGLYSRLAVTRPSPCPKSGSDDGLVVQFHFGSAQLKLYLIGDEIEWNGNNKGEPRSGSFGVLAYPEPCPACGNDEDQMYVIEFDGNRIVGFRMATPNDLDELEW